LLGSGDLNLQDRYRESQKANLGRIAAHIGDDETNLGHWIRVLFGSG
jgi:hypothetical protein